jgi:hypothetical protein
VNEILSKISSYNIFNYLFPGAVFIVVAERMGVISLPKLDIISLLLIYYSTGLVVSRIGSLLLEPFLKHMKLVEYSNYNDYLAACEKDKKIETLVEQNNTYRTIAGGLLCLLAAWPIQWVARWLSLTDEAATLTTLAASLALFIISYRKQSGYVTKRVQHHSSRHEVNS